MNIGKCSITFLSKYINQLETNIENYNVPSLYTETPDVYNVQEEEEQDENEERKAVDEEINVTGENLENQIRLETKQFLPFQSCRPINTPRICVWLFMGKENLQKFVTLKSKRKMRKILDKELGNTPKAFCRVILIEFLMDVVIFCVNSKFNLEQTSAILSIYYLTHKYFTDHLYVCPEDVLQYFKEFLLHHSLLFPPTHIKLFNNEESKGVLLHFCSLYLRHLPVVRLLILPNFGFQLDYELQPEEKPSSSKKGKKGDKDKSVKKDKSKKSNKK